MLAFILILISLTAVALWAAMTRSLLRSAICLAMMSSLLTMIMFMLRSPLAAVFELSVCAGLIPVLFISTISLTHPLTREEVLQHMKDRIRRFWYLPFIVVVVGVALNMISVVPRLALPLPEIEKDARTVLWNDRPIELLGQIMILLAGVFSVVILFKESGKDDR
ncbi:MAG: NADH-quinone oxidoreductase subunit J [Candidatus Omnitrophota bacterium]